MTRRTHQQHPTQKIGTNIQSNAIQQISRCKADTNKTISANYDVLAGTWFYNDEDELTAEGELIAYRGLFLIDKEGMVRHQLVNDLPLGRNVEEAIRVVDALQFNEENGEVCPANWTKGSEGMNATHDGVADYLAAH